MGPPTAHGLRTIISPLQVRGQGDFQGHHCGSYLQRNLAIYRGRSSVKGS